MNGGFYVYAAHHAVSADVSVDNAVYAIVFKLLAQIGDVVFGYGCPAINGNHAVFGIQPYDDVPCKSAAGFAHK